MKEARSGKTYKSPRRKLIRFFEKSRDQWKAKCRKAKKGVKRLQNRVRFLEASKARLKDRVNALETELARMKVEERSREKERDAQKKKATEALSVPPCVEEFHRVPAYHMYSLGHILLFVSFVLSASASFRCASRAMEIVFSLFQFPLPSPCWSTGRLWWLRLGYYKLTRVKEHAEDWVWIVDHTIQLGAEKCLVILGIRLSALPSPGRPLTLEDVQPLELVPVTQSNGEVVFQQLEETTAKTGVPREIISDHATDLHSGIARFCQSHPETCSVYDIKHKTAAVLKHELQADETWTAFTRLAGHTSKQVRQTALAALAPPQQRSKARYMNIDSLIRWGRHMLTFLDQPQAERSEAFDPEHVEAKLGWITTFREPLAEWEALWQILSITEDVVRTEGLYPEGARTLKKRLVGLASTPRTRRVRTQLPAFVTEESLKAQPHERLLGSSEVIESILGKLKRIEQDQAKSGFTNLLLSVAAMVSTTTAEVVQKAMETVRTQHLWDWTRKILGKSLQAKRREAFKSDGKTEQKQDQLNAAA